MASAGRILIMPKGDYDSNSTYDNLDLVKHKGTSWLAKKESKGIEPSEANAEYWQDVFEPNIANNLTTTAEGYALDARQGKVLNDKMIKKKAIEILTFFDLSANTRKEIYDVTTDEDLKDHFIFGVQMVYVIPSTSNDFIYSLYFNDVDKKIYFISSVAQQYKLIMRILYS